MAEIVSACGQEVVANRNNIISEGFSVRVDGCLILHSAAVAWSMIMSENNFLHNFNVINISYNNNFCKFF